MVESETQDLPDIQIRLIEAAGQVFAEQGFYSATVREICQRAGANVAAVNYHFDSKEKLYAAVLHYAHKRSFQHATPQQLQEGPPEERLRLFIRGLLKGILDHGAPVWLHQLMSREMMQPTPGLDMLIEKEIRPRSQMVCAIIREIVGPGLSEHELWLCCFSIVSQMFFYHHSRQVIQRLHPEMKIDLSMLDELADHVWRFALGALRARAAEKKEAIP
jgi:TetR/AcrR family transcriptional regulator, regulator of cefoperazone and chloramphenicol sensitivity